uniref:diacylglycerol O-acyltransferase n=1 Tax=Romanomermis culicivorax TaxID=13658 RepID=A0A915JQK1_ROMCU
MSDVKQRKPSKKIVDGAVETNNLKAGWDEALTKTPSSPSLNTIFEKPCHESQDSLLSGSSGYTNYRGFFNLSLILLFLSNARVALENIIKYGILIDPVSIVSIFLLKPHKSPVFYLILMINLYVLPCIYVEKRLFDEKMTQRTGVIFYTIDTTCMLLLPAFIIFMMRSTVEVFQGGHQMGKVEKNQEFL